MVWTPPATSWVAGFKPPAAWLKAQILDNFRAIGDPWTPYTPTWSTSGAAPSLGNGTLVGAYMQAGSLVNFWARLTIGSTTSVGTGNWTITPPTTANPLAAWIWTGRASDVSASANYPVRTNNGLGGIATDPTAAGGPLRSVNGTVPFTWAVGDTLDISGTYEAA